jgi:hypothetical protein
MSYDLASSNIDVFRCKIQLKIVAYFKIVLVYLGPVKAVENS